jgi:F-type H+-transporting ATPase subunit c
MSFKKLNSKKIGQFASAFGMFMLAGVSLAFAEGAEATGGHTEVLKWLALGSGLGLGIAANGGALGQGKMVAHAMEGIARNPQAAKDMFVPMILGLAFIEALSIYALIFVFIFKAAFPM